MVLTRRAIDVRYRGSFLGVYWSLLNPAVMSAVYAAVFGKTFTPYYAGSTLQYVISVFIGLVTLNFFVSATHAALTSIVDQAALINKVRIPLEAFPISAICAQTFQLGAGCVPLMVILALAVARNPWHVLLIPIPIAALVALALGVGFVVALLYVHFRDVAHMYDVFAFLLWITSPVFYPLAIVPDRVRSWLYLNPLLTILQSLRDVVLHPRLEAPQLLLADLGIGLVSCAAGWAAFRLARRHLADLL